MRFSLGNALALTCVLAMTLVSHAQRMPPAFGYNLNGQSVTRLAAVGTEAIVLFFIATDCPISNRYIPEMHRLEDKFTAHHVAFWFVYPNAGETPLSVRQHEAAYGTEDHILLDPHHQLVDFTQAKVTPQSVVLVPRQTGSEALRTVYRGRIDDRYVHIGQERPRATQHDLEQVIGDVLRHGAVQKREQPAIGCGIIGQP